MWYLICDCVHLSISFAFPNLEVPPPYLFFPSTGGWCSTGHYRVSLRNSNRWTDHQGKWSFLPWTTTTRFAARNLGCTSGLHPCCIFMLTEISLGRYRLWIRHEHVLPSSRARRPCYCSSLTIVRVVLFSTVYSPNIAITHIVDSVPGNAAEALVVINAFKNILAFNFFYIVVDWVHHPVGCRSTWSCSCSFW